MKNEFNKQIKIIFNDLYNPNVSIGRILTFFIEDRIVAHLSLSWPTKLWFAYHDGEKYINHYFPYYFNDYIKSDNSLLINIYIKDSILILEQNNLVVKFHLDNNIQFDRYEFMTNFEDSTIEHIDKNQYFVKLIDNNCKVNTIQTDIIITSYNDYDILPNLLDSIKDTIIDSNLINKIIIVNNNKDSNDKLLDIINKYNFKFTILNNQDDAYIKNRISGINLAIDQVDSDIITILDSDVIFTNSNWIQTYNLYNIIEDLTGVGHVADQMASHYFRDAQFILPRFHSCFFHCKKQYLKENINNDSDFLGDFKISLPYGNIKINAMGLHFSKLYADAREQMKKFYILDNNQIASLDRINNISSSYFEDIICVHFENMSFREVWKNNNYIAFKNNNILKSIKKLNDYNHFNILDNILRQYNAV